MIKEEYRILIIDDSEIIKMFFESIIEDNLDNYKVFFAKNGLKGIEMAKEISPDLIMLDIMMPNMNGFEVCEKLKNSKLTKQIPIVFYSAMNSVEDKAKAFELGAVDYIVKPVRPKELIARIKIQAEYYRSNQKIEIFNKKINEDMILAKNVQNDLLPKINRVRNFEFYWLFKPSFNVSGDIFDVIEIEDTVYAYLLDVSGHGVAAAMLSLYAKFQIEKILKNEKNKSVGEIIKILDESIKEIFSNEQYFTMILLKFYNDKVYVYNFAHRYPILCIGDKVFVEEKSNLPIGFNFYNNNETVIDYSEYSFKKNDCVFLYTDGMVEETNKNCQEYGFERIFQLIKSIKKDSIQEILEIINIDLIKFTEKRQYEDDITFFVIKNKE